MRPRFKAITKAGGMSDGATENFVYARGMSEGQGKIVIAPEAPPAIRQRKRGRGGDQRKERQEG
jgi:hypothetical protein